jgi:hypothetical protein
MDIPVLFQEKTVCDLSTLEGASFLPGDVKPAYDVNKSIHAAINVIAFQKKLLPLAPTTSSKMEVEPTPMTESEKAQKAAEKLTSFFRLLQSKGFLSSGPYVANVSTIQAIISDTAYHQYMNPAIINQWKSNPEQTVVGVKDVPIHTGKTKQAFYNLTDAMGLTVLSRKSPNTPLTSPHAFWFTSSQAIENCANGKLDTLLQAMEKKASIESNTFESLLKEMNPQPASFVSNNNAIVTQQSQHRG